MRRLLFAGSCTHTHTHTYTRPPRSRRAAASCLLACLPACLLPAGSLLPCFLLACLLPCASPYAGERAAVVRRHQQLRARRIVNACCAPHPVAPSRLPFPRRDALGATAGGPLRRHAPPRSPDPSPASGRHAHRGLRRPATQAQKLLAAHGTAVHPPPAHLAVRARPPRAFIPAHPQRQHPPPPPS